MADEQTDSELDQAVRMLRQRAAFAEARLTAAEAEIEVLQRRNERALELVSVAERRRAEAENWLEDHRRSLSWRLTEPMRALARRRRAHGASR